MYGNKRRIRNLILGLKGLSHCDLLPRYLSPNITAFLKLSLLCISCRLKEENLQKSVRLRTVLFISAEESLCLGDVVSLQSSVMHSLFLFSFCQKPSCFIPLFISCPLTRCNIQCFINHRGYKNQEHDHSL